VTSKFEVLLSEQSVKVGVIAGRGGCLPELVVIEGRSLSFCFGGIVFVIFSCFIELLSRRTQTDFITFCKKVALECSSIKHLLYLVFLVFSIFAIIFVFNRIRLITTGASSLISATLAGALAASKTFVAWGFCSRFIGVILVVILFLVFTIIVLLLAMVPRDILFQLLSPLGLEEFQRATAELSPFSIVHLSERSFDCLFLLSIILKLVITSSRTSECEHAPFKGELLEDQSHLDDCSKMPSGCSPIAVLPSWEPEIGTFV
jgi:hypothetical protein